MSNDFEDVIYELTKLKIKAHVEGPQVKYIYTKEQLIDLCIKMIKLIEREAKKE
ncbi:MAG TPA: hypothetical protein IAB59_00145 [Candidatus Onthousia faecipullorum]|uniref:Uncharacterized protein n=1 Tax=Candidatus Onthousia faecipullorum TaxID=2840887 RepID=A0A9D1KAR6_9FIRM|nr:hypothetical protein [Candidatus Onthousia faecipullorum]